MVLGSSPVAVTIGLSFMFAFSKSYAQNLEHKAIPEAFTLNPAPTAYRRYVDDTHARFESKERSCKFQKILNKLDKHIQFTVEDENGEKCLNFLGIKTKKDIQRISSKRKVVSSSSFRYERKAILLKLLWGRGCCKSYKNMF